MKRFTDEPLLKVVQFLQAQASRTGAGAQFAVEACRPECKGSRHEGSIITADGVRVRARSLRAWTDAAETIDCRLLTPIPIDDCWMRLSFQKLDRRSSWHDAPAGTATEKYGVDSPFADIDKREDPMFLDGFAKSTALVRPQAGDTVLNLGINTGDEFALLGDLLPEGRLDTMHLVGVDHCASAIAHAEKRFGNKNMRFICGDINRLDTLNLPGRSDLPPGRVDVSPGRFDIIISIGTLQSPGIETKRVFMSLVQDHLAANGAVILGFPNCRYADGEILYGAKTKNFTEPELSLLIKDIQFAKKYLQQHRFKVRIFGKHYLFLVGTRS